MPRLLLPPLVMRSTHSGVNWKICRDSCGTWVTVTQSDPKHSHWVAEGPGGRSQYQWDAEIINEVQDELIAWKSLPGSEVDSAGSVRFNDAPGGRGTEIRVELQYNPPAGIVGAWVARFFVRGTGAGNLRGSQAPEAVL